MGKVNRIRRNVKPATCECHIILHPVLPFLPHYTGLRGIVEINGLDYDVRGICEWRDFERTLLGYAFEKKNGAVHNVCLVAGRLECTCGDWVWRRTNESKLEAIDCKHCKAVRQLLPLPVDLNPQPLVRVPAKQKATMTIELEDL